MRFKKIKMSKGKICLEWEIENKKKDWDQFSLACIDEPRPEFHEALQALVVDMVSICELPEDYGKRILITGCSFSYAGENSVMGCTITAQMYLSKSNVALNLNTPHKSSEPYSEGGDASQCLSEDCIERLTYLMLEAEDYVNGKRAQGELFVDKGDSTQEKERGVVFS